jgi:rRNA-processing protein FCF1
VISREQTVVALISRHRQRGVLVDTNLLLLFLVGVFDPRYISRYIRTASYDEEDFNVLAQVLQTFRRIIVTPHILTEVSNLSRDIDRGRRYEFFLFLASLLNALSGHFLIDEQHRPAKLISTESEFPLLGLTDAAIIHRAAHHHNPVLTDDRGLSERLERRGIDRLNFQDLRTPHTGGRL